MKVCIIFERFSFFSRPPINVHAIAIEPLTFAIHCNSLGTFETNRFSSRRNTQTIRAVQLRISTATRLFIRGRRLKIITDVRRSAIIYVICAHASRIEYVNMNKFVNARGQRIAVRVSST